MTERFSNAIQIELHVPDLDLAVSFYSLLGFSVVWKRQKDDEGDYLVIERDGCIINFWPGNEQVYEQEYFKRFPKDTKRGYGVEIVFVVDDIDTYYTNLSDEVNVVEELKVQPWGLKDFRIEDPFGYYLRITEPHDILDPSNAVD